MFDRIRQWIQRRLPPRIKESFGRVWPSLIYWDEAIQQKRFSVRLYLILRASNWYPERCLEFNDSKYLEMTHSEAMKVFQEFGQLMIPSRLSAVVENGYFVEIEVPYERDRDCLAKWQDSMLTHGLYMLGSLDCCLPIWVDVEGSVYETDGRDVTRMVAPTFDKAFERWVCPSPQSKSPPIKGKVFKEIDDAGTIVVEVGGPQRTQHL